MDLSDAEKASLRAIFEKARNKAPEIGGEALERTFLTFPATKTYFPHFDLSPGSAQVREQGRKVIIALADSLDNVDNLDDTLDTLADLYAHRLRMDPTNFRFLTHGMLVTLSNKYPEDFTPEVHTSMEKFLDSVSAVLASKYR